MQELFIPYSENIIIPSIKWQQVFKLIDCGNKNFKGRYPKSCKQKSCRWNQQQIQLEGVNELNLDAVINKIGAKRPKLIALSFIPLWIWEIPEHFFKHLSIFFALIKTH